MCSWLASALCSQYWLLAVCWMLTEMLMFNKVELLSLFIGNMCNWLNWCVLELISTVNIAIETNLKSLNWSGLECVFSSWCLRSEINVCFEWILQGYDWPMEGYILPCAPKLHKKPMDNELTGSKFTSWRMYSLMNLKITCGNKTMLQLQLNYVYVMFQTLQEWCSLPHEFVNKSVIILPSDSGATDGAEEWGEEHQHGCSGRGTQPYQCRHLVLTFQLVFVTFIAWSL